MTFNHLFLTSGPKPTRIAALRHCGIGHLAMADAAP
jgi:hypothetical protein